MLLPKMFVIVISQYIIFIWAGYIQEKLIDSKVIKVVRFGPCPRTNLPYKLFVQVGKINLREALITNATITVKEDLEDKLKLTISITRCRSRENLDSCEDYYKIRNLDFCQGISQDTLPASTNPFSIPFEPKLKCPIKQGIYQAHNFTFNLTPFILFSVDGWYWKCMLEIFSSKENNRRVACTTAEGYTQLS